MCATAQRTPDQYNWNCLHTLHIVHCQGEDLTKPEQPASSLGWDTMVSWGKPGYIFNMETAHWSSWSKGNQESGHCQETGRNHMGHNLNQIYMRAVKPDVDSASTTWNTASKLNKANWTECRTWAWKLSQELLEVLDSIEHENISKAVRTICINEPTLSF